MTPTRPPHCRQKIGPCGTAVRHEERIVDKRRIRNAVGDGSQRVPGRQQNLSAQVADKKDVPVREQHIPDGVGRRQIF